MPKTDLPPDQLRKGAKVVAATAMRDVPEGTEGRVIVVNGLTWIRYWVRFDNGVQLGSIPRSSLATRDQWKRYLAGEPLEGVGPVADAGGAADAGAADDDGGGGGKATPAGTMVPQKLLDRAAAARARLAA